VDATVALRFDDGSLALAIRDGQLDVSVGALDTADLTLTTETPATVAAFLSGAIDAAALAPEGDEALLARLPAIFPFVAHE
jgi:hypothetical protein